MRDSKNEESAQSVKSIEKADGFAQVFPEDKYNIVDVLQKHNHIVGMTGDGVNDAPALKKADCGIAVSGATDAARAAVYANEEPVRRLLQVPFEQQPNMDPEREWFLAARSMRDTEPVSLLKIRRPDGGSFP